MAQKKPKTKAKKKRSAKAPKRPKTATKKTARKVKKKPKTTARTKAKKRRRASAGNTLRTGDSEVLSRIKESYAEGTLIPFIGAGFPRNIGGFPDWDDFVKRLTASLTNDCQVDFGDKTLLDIFPNDNIRATEYYVLKMGRKIVDENESPPTLENIFRAGKEELSGNLRLEFQNVEYKDTVPMRKAWRVYREFIKLENFNVLYTTNWDPSIEKINDAMLKKDARYELVYTDQSLRAAVARKTRRLLIKYHGHFTQHNSIIAAESDYFHRLMHRTFLDVKLFHDLLHYDFLFLGWSFNDIFIRMTVNEVGDMLCGTSDQNLPWMFMVHVGKLHPVMAEYFAFGRITPFCICEEWHCKHFDDVHEQKDCQELEKEGRCALKDYLVRFFQELKQVE